MMSMRCLGTAMKALIGLAGLLGVASCSLDGAEYVSGRAGGTVLTSATVTGAEALPEIVYNNHDRLPYYEANGGMTHFASLAGHPRIGHATFLFEA